MALDVWNAWILNLENRPHKDKNIQRTSIRTEDPNPNRLKSENSERLLAHGEFDLKPKIKTESFRSKYFHKFITRKIAAQQTRSLKSKRGDRRGLLLVKDSAEFIYPSLIWRRKFILRSSERAPTAAKRSTRSGINALYSQLSNSDKVAGHKKRSSGFV